MRCIACKKSMSVFSSVCPHCSYYQRRGVYESLLAEANDPDQKWSFGWIGAAVAAFIGMAVGGLWLSVLFGLLGAGVAGGLQGYIRSRGIPGTHHGEMKEDLGERLQQIDKLWSDGLITDQEREETRRRILNEL